MITTYNNFACKAWGYHNTDTHSLPCSGSRLLTTKPTLPELLNLKTSSGSTINIVQQMGTHYHILGPLLLRDDTSTVTSAIASQHQRDVALINQEILTRWLQGQGKLPVSWSTLIDVLKNAGLLEIAQMIQESLIAQTSGEINTRCSLNTYFVFINTALR